MCDSINLSYFSETKRHVLRATLLLTIFSVAVGIFSLKHSLFSLNFVQANLLMALPSFFFVAIIAASKYRQSKLLEEKKEIENEKGLQNTLASPLLKKIETPIPVKKREDIDCSLMTYERFQNQDIDPAITQRGFVFVRSTAWLSTPAYIEPFAKVHVSIDRAHLTKAFDCLFPFLMKHKPRFKILVDTSAQFNSLGKEFVIYFGRADRQREIEEIQEFFKEGGLCDQMVALLEQAGVRAGTPSLGDLPFKRGKNFVYFRFDVTPFSKSYIPIEPLVLLDFTRRESALLTNERLLDADIFGSTVLPREIPAKHFGVKLEGVKRRLLDGLIEKSEWKPIELWSLVVNEKRNKYFNRFLCLPYEFEDGIYSLYEAFFGKETEDNPFTNYLKALRNPEDDVTPPKLSSIVYFEIAGNIVAKMCHDIDPNIYNWTEYDFGIPISTFYYEFFLPFKALNITVTEGNLQQPFKDHPNVEERFVKALVKCAFRKWGAQCSSIDPVYTRPEAELDKAIATYYAQSKDELNALMKV